MKRVIGIGGIFFKSSDPDRLRAWYQKHLGLEPDVFRVQIFDLPQDARELSADYADYTD